MCPSARASAGVVLVGVCVALGIAAAPSTAAAQQPARYRCTFAFEPDARRAVVVTASCEVCTSGTTERCGPASISNASAWITAADGRGARRRMRASASPGEHASDGVPLRVTLHATLAPGAYVLHFVPAARATASEFRESFEIDSARHVQRR